MLIIPALLMSLWGFAIQIQVVDGVQIPDDVFGRPHVVENNGPIKYVSLHTLEADQYNLKLVAYGSKGRELASMKVRKPLENHDFRILDAIVSSKGEILVTLSEHSRGGDTTIFLDNLMSGKATTLIGVGDFPQVLDRIEYGDKGLVAVASGLGRGTGNTRPQLVRIIEEDTGKVVSQIFTDYPSSGKLGVDQNNQLKLLLFGFEIFGVVDVTANQFQELLPTRQQPSSYPSEVELSFGTFLSFQDENSLRLFDYASLFEGRLSTEREYPVGTRFLSPAEGRTVAAFATEAGLQIANAASGELLGPAIPSSHPGMIPGLSDVAHSESGQLIALIAEPGIPHSFLPGTILRYIDIATGEVLRQRKSQDNCHTQLLKDQSQKLHALESCTLILSGGETAAQLVDIELNQELERFSNKFISPVFKSKSGKFVALNEEDEQLCLIEVLNRDNRHCFEDPLHNPAVKYGYKPLKVSPGQITLPLLEAHQDRYRQLGFITYQVH